MRDPSPSDGPELPFPDAEALARLDELTVDLHELQHRAATLAPALIGLSLGEASNLVGEHRGVTLVVRAHRGRRSAKGVFGRIAVEIVEDKIVWTSLS